MELSHIAFLVTFLNLSVIYLSFTSEMLPTAQCLITCLICKSYSFFLLFVCTQKLILYLCFFHTDIGALA